MVNISLIMSGFLGAWFASSREKIGFRCLKVWSS
jgi:hypothetical protein